MNFDSNFIDPEMHLLFANNLVADVRACVRRDNQINITGQSDNRGSAAQEHHQ